MRKSIKDFHDSQPAKNVKKKKRKKQPCVEQETSLIHQYEDDTFKLLPCYCGFIQLLISFCTWLMIRKTHLSKNNLGFMNEY